MRHVRTRSRPRRHAKRHARRSGRRRSRRNTRPYTSSITVPGRSLFPNKLFTKLYYEDYFVVTMVAGVLNNFIYRGNSCFDPDNWSAGGGHQPFLYDQYVALYGLCTVLACKMKATVRSYASATPAYGSQWFLSTYKDALVPSDITEDPRSIQKFAGTYFNFQPVHLSSYAKTATLFGVNDDEVTGDYRSYAHSSTANPTLGWSFRLNGYSFSVASTDSFVVEFRQTFYCMFTQPVVQVQG